MKKVLILGVNGFIGLHLTKHILETTDWDVFGMDMFADKPGDASFDQLAVACTGGKGMNTFTLSPVPVFASA